MKVEYHLLTVSDLNRAVAHYDKQRAALGDALRTEVYEAIERILASSTQFPRSWA
jgi:hypothetical protein